MGDSFGLLKKLTITFKVLAFFVFILMLVGLVGTLMAARNAQAAPPLPVILNMVFSGILAFLMLFTFGEVIRILVAIEAQTRKA